MLASDIAQQAADRRERELREWQAEQRKDDMQCRADEAMRADARHAEQMRQGRWQIVLVGIVATIVLAAASIVGSLIQAGRLFPASPK